MDTFCKQLLAIYSTETDIYSCRSSCSCSCYCCLSCITSYLITTSSSSILFIAALFKPLRVFRNDFCNSKRTRSSQLDKGLFFFSFHSIFKTKCYYLCGQYFNRIITVFISYFKHWQVQRYISVHVSLCFRQHIFIKFWAKFSFVCRVETRTIITVNVSWDFDLGRIILGKKYLHQFWAMFSTLLKLLR